MGISISITGLEPMQNKLKELSKTLRRPLLKEIGEYLVQSTTERFEEESDPSGNEWKLKDSTVKRKRKTGHTKKLQVSGKLKQSIANEIKGKELKIGTDREYGEYLQEGTKSMEAKAFLGLSSEDEDAIADIIEDRIREALL